MKTRQDNTRRDIEGEKKTRQDKTLKEKRRQ